MVHFNQPGEECTRVRGGVIERTWTFGTFFSSIFLKPVFDSSDSLFTPRSLSQVLLENLGATHCGASLFLQSVRLLFCGPTLFFLSRVKSPVFHFFYPLVPSAWVSWSFSQLLKLHIRLEGNHSNANQTIISICRFRAAGEKKVFKWLIFRQRR